jgi:hypothetical protein
MKYLRRDAAFGKLESLVEAPGSPRRDQMFRVAHRLSSTAAGS